MQQRATIWPVVALPGIAFLALIRTGARIAGHDTPGVEASRWVIAALFVSVALYAHRHREATTKAVRASPLASWSVFIVIAHFASEAAFAILTP